MIVFKILEKITGRKKIFILALLVLVTPTFYFRWTLHDDIFLKTIYIYIYILHVMYKQDYFTIWNAPRA